MVRIAFIICITFYVYMVNSRAQGISPVAGRDYVVVFWNVENFFDTRFDPGKEDGTFIPTGEKRWTRSRFIDKRNGIAKTIIDIESFPALIGLAEIENRYVLNQLIYETPLAMGGYAIVHRDSPDRRGIDVALLYCRSQFRPLKNSFIRVNVADSTPRDSATAYVTREILYSKGVLHDLDTLHIFVNHWPSKFGGEDASAPYREAAADALAGVCDSILAKSSRANILVMGDFNDTPDSEVIKNFEQRCRLRVLRNYRQIDGRLFTKRAAKVINTGTIKYKGVWEQIDMFMVSENLLDSREPISTGDEYFSLFSPTYLLERDRAYTGFKPKRGYIGPRYNGGVSDHLPVILKIKRNW
ncbi:MAG: endonuclease [Bacteroidetes bacterium HGW-Bacteroidetes-5]|jgi:predicted extracellular nuclease|nr:MAG: endonuclease [Bacteroidetes bacterium HGW-Bacteroidetes-5]